MTSARGTAIVVAWVGLVAGCEGKTGATAAHEGTPAPADRAAAPAAAPAAAAEAPAEGAEEAPTPVAARDRPAPPAKVDPAGEPITCQGAAKNLVAVMEPELQKQLAKLPEAERADAEKKMRAAFSVDALQAQCLQQKLGPRELRCIMDAKSPEDLKTCQSRAPGAQPPPAGAGNE